MNTIDISKLKEGDAIEFKESFKDDALKSICAFANTKGGVLYIGVKDDVSLIGGEITDNIQQGIVSKIESQLGIQPEIIVRKEKTDEFLEIKVKKSFYPVSFRGRFYKRVGNTTRELGLEELKEFLLRDIPWDSQINAKATFEDLDFDVIQSVLTNNKKELIGTKTALIGRGYLEHSGLASDETVTNAAILLFGKRANKLFSSAKIRIGRFKGESTIIADEVIEGNLFSQLFEAERVIKTLVNKRYNITGQSFQREEVWDYPLEAVREAVLNALVHRSYHITNAHIEIKIFDEHILFYSPGKLPDGITLEQLNRAHPSIRRNPLLAETFFRAGYIEQFGSGTLRMKQVLKSANHPEPEFSEEGSTFVVKFNKVTEPVEINENAFNNRQLEILKIAKRNTIFKMADITEVLGKVNERTLRRDLTELIEAGVLSSEGEKRGRTYNFRKDYNT